LLTFSYTVVDVKAPLPCTEILASTNPSNDALVEASISVQGNGALTSTTV
jgi:hypothetical protein